MKTTATALLAELESLNENAYALPTFSSGMRSSPATRRRRLEEWRSKRRESHHMQNCVACTPPSNRVLARLSLAAVAKRCAPVNTPKEVMIRLDGADVSPLTFVCTPIASPASNAESSHEDWSAATPAYDNSYDQSDYSDLRRSFGRIPQNQSGSRTASSGMTDDGQYNGDHGLDSHCEDRLDCSDYEDSVVEAYQNMQDVEDDVEVLDSSTSSIDQEVPSLAAAISAIRSFEWNDSLPLSSPFPEQAYQNRELLPRRLNNESEGTSEGGSLFQSTPRRNQVEGSTVLFALPENDVVNDLSSARGKDYERLLVENRRLHKRLQALAALHDVTMGPIRDLYIEVSGVQ